ncbi:hypothetical protein SDC9_107140 [bioreactor metagenome]|uniref:Uncharacterized protein n=1 Tax=bioreactor metagenome TaxID=1076179 RepID=A0A645B4D6_9ZZZZ
MKNKTQIKVSLILAFVFVFTLVGTAGASASGQATVTPVTGDSSFTVSPVAVLQLPGQTTTASGLVVPSGFPAGEKQFEGNGVTVSGLSYGTAKACFPISALNQGWGGKVGYWDGSVWKLLDTTISTPAEGTFSWACANISNNGTYALITWVVDASKLVVTKTKLPECSFAGEYSFNDNYGYVTSESGLYIGIDTPEIVPLGSTVTYKIIQVDPDWDGKILTGMTGSTAVQSIFGSNRAWFSKNILTFDTSQGPALTARFTFVALNCTVDLDYEAFDWKD